MPDSKRLYQHSFALLTDLYQLTMAYGYWKNGMADKEACFSLFFRKLPFQGGFAIAAGLEYVVDYLADFQFSTSDLEYLATLEQEDGSPLFPEAFLDYLAELELKLDVSAIPEGTVVFPNEPLIRVSGPIIQCQLIETFLLNSINFQTIIATKAARICLAANFEPILEFGLRRAHGIDGGISASRAAFIGGCVATSNVLAGKLFGIPVRGTHAHSWVMTFESEIDAFMTYAEAMPKNVVLLVDTYDTLQGVKNAIATGKKLKEKGCKLAGIRLDSGDLAYLSIEARNLLDEAGFEETFIAASNDLDEHLIKSLKEQGAKISVWGVGTNLVTAFDQPALGGVYKLSALKNEAGEWMFKIKISEQQGKINTPGVLNIRRFWNKDQIIADMIYEENILPEAQPLIVDPGDYTRQKKVSNFTFQEELLVSVFEKGTSKYQKPKLQEIRERTLAQLSALHPTIKRFVNPHTFPVGLEEKLFNLRTNLILANRLKKQEND